MLKNMALLFLVASCSLFKSAPTLKSQDTEKLLDAVQMTGEGRGRLTLGQSQYVFSVDSILKEDFDWILAVTIPLHGEEVMILPDLRQSQIADEETESFEERIEKEFQRLKLNKKLSSEQFLKELRTLIRFGLAKKLGLKRDCKAQQTEFVCDLNGEKFTVNVTDKELNINKSLGEEKRLQLVAKNLTDSFFAQTDIRLYSDEAEFQKKASSFSLELFWKN
jgi:hypothetical protein